MRVGLLRKNIDFTFDNIFNNLVLKNFTYTIHLLVLYPTLLVSLVDFSA